MQASPSSPFIFYLQSELSKEQSCPFWNLYPCTKMNITKGTEHLKLFNVNHVIAVSEEAKASFNNNSEYKLVKQIEDYSIYELTTNQNNYVTLANYQPFYMETTNWKQASYDWFRYSNTQIPVVFDKAASQYQITNLSQLKPIPVNQDCSIKEKVEQKKITVQTTFLNKPLIIKISYHPGWKIKQGAEKIYLVSPSFMLLYPKEGTIILEYSGIPAKKLGVILSLAGIFIMILFIYKRRK